ncbi:tryptophan-rich sensory protein [Streptomyces goshikiensis]|uniref:tryptophan-rich sensory protein n=1 Tax=Streptomyces goshikiensis TaxID=1942 RepID=UPI00340ADEEA
MPDGGGCFRRVGRWFGEGIWAKGSIASRVVAVAAAATAGSVAIDVHTDWYRSLNGLAWQPPSGAYGLVWTPLYASIALAAGQARGRTRGPASHGARATQQVGVQHAHDGTQDCPGGARSRSVGSTVSRSLGTRVRSPLKSAWPVRKERRTRSGGLAEGSERLVVRSRRTWARRSASAQSKSWVCRPPAGVAQCDRRGNRPSPAVAGQCRTGAGPGASTLFQRGGVGELLPGETVEGGCVARWS